jgi:OOP family OmpA-OmpF porin
MFTAVVILLFLSAGCAHSPQPSSGPGGEKASEPAVRSQFPETVTFKVKGDECKVIQEVDSDADGVPDSSDECPCTPFGVKVDEKGCPLDGDGDGVPDYLDNCPCTEKGVKVDEHGCPVDSDGDGVLDTEDKCPGTPAGAKVDATGCWIIGDALFDLDKHTINPLYYPLLDDVVSVLKRHDSLKIMIEGHTCSLGGPAYNLKLSEKRAESVKQYLIMKGISGSRLTTVGYGMTRPVSSNKDEAGRVLNRRVHFVPVWPR